MTRFLIWLWTPSTDPINRVCSMIAAGAVLFLAGILVGAGLGR